MATLGKVHGTAVDRLTTAHQLDRTLGRMVPRRCMVIAVGLIVGGLTLALLMAIDLLPATFALGLLGWALVAFGGYRLLTGCGEIG